MAIHQIGLLVHSAGGSDADDYADDFRRLFRSVSFRVGDSGKGEDSDEIDPRTSPRYGVWVRWSSAKQREWGWPPVGQALVDALGRCEIDVTPIDIEDWSFFELIVYRRRPE